MPAQRPAPSACHASPRKPNPNLREENPDSLREPPGRRALGAPGLWPGEAWARRRTYRNRTAWVGCSREVWGILVAATGTWAVGASPGGPLKRLKGALNALRVRVRMQCKWSVFTSENRGGGPREASPGQRGGGGGQDGGRGGPWGVSWKEAP